MIIPGICRVNDMGGASTFTQLAMSHDYHIAPMHEFAERLHRHGAKLCIQLHHPGRQGMASAINSLPLVIPVADRFPGVMDQVFKCTPLLLGMEARGVCFSVQAPSKVELAKHGATRMHAMSKKEIHDLIDDFIEAAVRCQKAGVDCVELHAGHGYIIQQFLSPHTNRRTDEYGGSFDKRMRFITEIIQGIRARCGRDYPLTVRLTADEMYAKIGREGVGYDLETGKQIAKRLEELTVDAINVTSACYDAYNYWLEPTSFEPGWRAYLARAIKETVKIPVIAANFIRSPEQAERQLKEGVQDMVGSARNFICDPDWAAKAEAGRPEEIRRCIGCLHCIESFIANAGVGKPGECALNMGVANERAYASPPQVGKGRAAVVVGAGPAGLTAAVELRRRGFETTVFEKAEGPGGQVRYAAAGPLKEKLQWCVEDLMTQAKTLGVVFRFGEAANKENVASLKPAAIILATGAKPARPRGVPGIDRENVYTAPQILTGEVGLKEKRVVVVGSGLTGLETAHALAEQGNTVTVIEAADTVAPKAWFQHVDDSLSRLKPLGVRILTGTPLQAVTENGAAVNAGGKTETLPAEAVVLAMGVRPDKSLLDDMQNITVQTFVAGDAAGGGSIGRANHSAYAAACRVR